MSQSSSYTFEISEEILGYIRPPVQNILEGSDETLKD
jgi:hypothetical protein